MDILWHNPLANMYGPDFLKLYVVVIIVTIFLCAKKSSDPTKKLSPLLVPEQPDPYEIAYLRSGEPEVTKVVIFSLIQKGWLQVNEKQEIERSPQSHKNLELTSIEAAVNQGFNLSYTPRSLMGNSTLAKVVRDYSQPYKQLLENEQLFYPNQLKEQKKSRCLWGFLLIAGLGIYKLMAALNTGHRNVGFLMILGIIGCIILLVIAAYPSPRLSYRGESYLSRLQTAFSGLKQQDFVSLENALDLSLLLLAIFGIQSLLDTPYNYYSSLFYTPTVDSGSSCSSSSSCSSGSSCGGGSCGGGGCGGGGCGGCGS